jgi:hypothetical protein
MGLIALAVLVLVVLVGWSNHRTRAIYLAGLTPEERAEERASEEVGRADREAKRLARRKPITLREFMTAAIVVVVLLVALAMCWLFAVARV